MAEEVTIRKPLRVRSDIPFLAAIWAVSGMYVLLIVLLLAADSKFTSFADIWAAMKDPDIRKSIWLTFHTCWISAVLSVFVAVPTGYILSRFQFRGKRLLDAMLDIPIVLPPLVIGLSLLILFSPKGLGLEKLFAFFLEPLHEWNESIPAGVTYKIPAVILAQFTVACAFAVRTMRNTFDQINPRQEQVALTLGCNRSQAFWSVVLPEAGRGVVTAGTLAWARALGEFGPILVFAGATRGKTEVLSTTVFLEISIGNLEGAVAVSMLMVTAAVLVLVLVRSIGTERVAA